MLNSIGYIVMGAFYRKRREDQERDTANTLRSKHLSLWKPDLEIWTRSKSDLDHEGMSVRAPNNFHNHRLPTITTIQRWGRTPYFEHLTCVAGFVCLRMGLNQKKQGWVCACLLNNVGYSQCIKGNAVVNLKPSGQIKNIYSRITRNNYYE